MIKVQTEPFNVGEIYQNLANNNAAAGAVVFFVGQVRDYNQNKTIRALTLEHYPAMTEKVLSEIVNEAERRWPLQAVSLVHRVGRMLIGDEIVFVGVASAHRQAAFAASQFIMDKLKTQAPFWKKEETETGNHWVEARESDIKAADNW
ncbi:molybdopterin synthase catalytic subunit MoaE [Gayadomonas joobiniege]|uniref:molybdopterin synthase catalytic subunit MoaE n=1 Tax=Gayadomonas joobiniege TaxID=1234606 RepID=UPI0003826497|nr:molybdopterin synthase catalytic subunit MoaE [Gayadomonas joobiniege]